MSADVRLPLDEYRSRRDCLAERLRQDNAALILGSGHPSTYSGSIENRFRAFSDFFYVTGFREPHATLVFRPDADKPLTMFVQPRNPEREIWDGLRAGPEGAQSDFGADQAFDDTELGKVLPDLLEGIETLYYEPFRDSKLDARVRAAIQSIKGRERLGKVAPFHFVDPGSLLHPMRQIKSAAEQDLMRHAAQISAKAHIAAMKRCRPGVQEYQLQATIEGVFAEHGAAGPGYLTIVGSGANGCILHYIQNQSEIQDGDLVLIDAGAEYAGYCGDITRTFPASGSFVGAQADFYEIVRKTEQSAIDMVRPGSSIDAIHTHAVRSLTTGLINLGLIEGPLDEAIEKERYKKYFMHRTSHWIGIDVHDVGPYTENGKPRELVPGMVFTVEPGLYIPADDESAPKELRGQGVRIEDDVIVTADGCEILTRDVPVDAKSVCELVGSDA